MNYFISYSFILFTFLSCLSNQERSVQYQNILDMTQIKEYEDARIFRNEAYCYYVFQEVITPMTITPDLFEKFIKGGSLNLSFVDDYERWLQTTSGVNCIEDLGGDFIKLKKNSNKSYAILLNVNAIIADGKKREITLKHELLHVVFSVYKDKRVKLLDLWNSKTLLEKNAFINAHPGYKFENKKVLLKEFFSYTFETDIEKGIQLLTD